MIDNPTKPRYYKHKLVRFTGVPLQNSGVWRLTKTNSGLKQTNVPLRVGAHQRKRSDLGRFSCRYKIKIDTKKATYEVAFYKALN